MPLPGADHPLGDLVQGRQVHFSLFPHYALPALSASTPGRVLPSIHSRNAPPAVETKVKSPADAGRVQGRHRITAAGHRHQFAGLGQRSAAWRAAATVPRSNGGTSKTPSGPFQTRVADASIAAQSRSTVCGPASRMRSCGSISPSSRTRAAAPGSGLLGDHDVDRQQQLAVARVGERHDASRGVGQLLLAVGGADLPALREEEGVGHAAADRQPVELDDQVVQQVELGRDLRAADDAHHRPLRDRPARASSAASSRRICLAGVGRQKVGDRIGRGVGAVRGREGVVDVEVAVAPPAAWRTPGRRPPRRRGSAGSPAAARRRPSSPRRPCSATSPTQSSANATGAPSSFASGATTGFRLIEGTRLPFGRSKWLIRITLAPPSRRRRMVGSAASQAGVVGDLRRPPSAR